MQSILNNEVRVSHEGGIISVLKIEGRGNSSVSSRDEHSCYCVLLTSGGSHCTFLHNIFLCPTLQ